MKLVLFLGAGFSRPAGLPTMTEFFGAVNARPDISEADKQFVRTLRQHARRGASMLVGPHDNLEHVLSFAMMCRDGESAICDGNASSRLRSILQRVYCPLDGESRSRLMGWFRTFLGLHGARSFPDELTVITTNYDVVAEFALYSIGVQCRLPFATVPFDPEQGRGYDLYDEDSRSAVILKLHGSANWFPGEEGGPIRVEGAVVPVYRPDGISDKRDWYLPRVSTSDYFQRNPEMPVPIIIPPTLYKQQHQKELEVMWQIGHKSLAEADRVVFIGYSFPESDTYMAYFLAAALVENVDLARIDIVDPNADLICDRLGNGNYGEHFKQLLRPAALAWQLTRNDPLELRQR